MGCGDLLLEEEEEEVQFFDAREDISSASDSCPSSPSCSYQNLDESPTNWDSYDRQYRIWLMKPDSIEERRSKFKQRMGFSSPPKNSLVDLNMEAVQEDGCCADDVERITSDYGAELRGSDSENEFLMSSWSSECSHSSQDDYLDENFVYRIKNLDDGSTFVADELSQDGVLTSLREVGSDRVITLDEFNRSIGQSPLVQRFMRREDNTSYSSTSLYKSVSKGRRVGWLNRLGIAACVIDREDPGSNFMPHGTDENISKKCRRVGVYPHKKRTKEFSAVYLGQDIKAHEGAIWTMKFSPDGRYLASGGEDGIVRVWKVLHREWEDECDILEEENPSCLYFRANSSYELTCIYSHEERKSGVMKKTSDSACVVIPPKVFRIAEKPLHEFDYHSGEILCLSWSHNEDLISSSMDGTVCLWHVGHESCLRAFKHNDYVTSIHFNPIDDDYFISGSIDGKVRIWNVSGGNVVDWTDVKEIVTAVCYRPDGKAVVIGSISGNCRFYSVLDNQMQLDNQVSFQSKKKSSSKRITGFQFSPKDTHMLMVTSADSQVRILNGYNVIHKYKGLRNAGSQISASFTSDGMHIVSASEDSNVYIWNHSSHGAPVNHVKSTSSYERFASNSVSVAIAWQGLDSRNHLMKSETATSHAEVLRDMNGATDRHLTFWFDLLGNSNVRTPASVNFALIQEFLTEVVPRASATTWPEEKLPSSSVIAPAALCKSQYKFLKSSCQNSVASPHAWGRVIVTAGCDGRIRSFHNYGLPVHT